jgi:hypothetical protein
MPQEGSLKVSASCIHYNIAVPSTGRLFISTKGKFPVAEEMFSSYLNERWQFGYVVSCEMCQCKVLGIMKGKPRLVAEIF